MKRNILLVTDGDADSNAIIAEAAKQTGHGLTKTSSDRQAFEILNMATEDVDLAIIDLDPGIHSLSILEAMGWAENSPPIIVVTNLEESEAAPIASRHGAAACIGKPFTASQLVSAIEQVCSSWRPQTLSCDFWGHPHSRRQRTPLDQPA
jgi:DNA-binding response OmpR family regulator